jgi:hypothetical protein
MCERYAKYLGLEKYLVMGKSVRGEWLREGRRLGAAH